MNLKVTVTKTADGKFNYIQVMSEDQLRVNVVMVAEQIEVLDLRPNGGKKPVSAIDLMERSMKARRKKR